MKTKVFISQSGARSRALAEKLKVFVRKLTPTEPWTSLEIPKGDQWASDLAARLKDAGAGMACLTPENLTEPWILFEAGALSRTPSEKVWTVLLDVKPTDVRPPLGWRQHTEVDKKDDVFRMIESINATADAPNDSDDLHDLFERLWPDLHADVEKIRAMPTDAVVMHREQGDVLAEVLDIVRDTERVTTWRTDKALRMLHRIYEAIFHEKAPSLVEMREADRGSVTPKDFERLGADPLRSFIADTPLPLKANEPNT